MKLSLTKEEFLAHATRGNLIPVSAEILADTETPVSAFAKLGNHNYSFLLESVEQSEPVGRFSILGCDPDVIFRSRERTITIEEHGAVRTFETQRDPLHELRDLMARYRYVALPQNPALEVPEFVGGAVGFLSWDTVRFFEPGVAPPPKDELDLPDTVFLITSSFILFDHRSRRLRIVANAHVQDGNADAAYDQAASRIGGILKKLQTPSVLRPIEPIVPDATHAVQCNTTPQEYMDMVIAAQEYIRAGDVFQIVPSQRFETDFHGDPVTLYRALRFVNPSPYMFCLRCAGEFSLVGSSPEVHVRLMNGRIEIRPVAGTRKRGTTLEEDVLQASELLADPKERAEHIMLVDLARNDVGRIARYGSVAVTDFMTIERYSHVMHIVSNVEGELAEGRDAYDVMRATFPAGTVSGSPKVRAMQIINELEKSKRCAYAGAVGYFGFDGNLDSCITLRTVTMKDDRAYVQAGAGVVADSTPEGEYEETVNKAMAMMRAIEIARNVSPVS